MTQQLACSPYTASTGQYTGHHSADRTASTGSSMEARASPCAIAVRATSTATVLDVMRRSAFDGSREAPGAVSVAWLATACAAAKIISSLTFAARETMTPKPRPGYRAALFAWPIL